MLDDYEKDRQKAIGRERDKIGRERQSMKNIPTVPNLSGDRVKARVECAAVERGPMRVFTAEGG